MAESPIAEGEDVPPLTTPQVKAANRRDIVDIRKKWSAADIPDQAGKVAIVTGANSGLGLVIAGELARAGAQVVLACRDVTKGAKAAEQITAKSPKAQLSVQGLDLAALSSVHEFAAAMTDRYPRIDLLINNAGVMATARGTTAEGYELQFGTNHLGPFALTGLLLPALLSAPEGRVVAVSSTFHGIGTIQLDNLKNERGYNRYSAYGRSKLANLMFSRELDRLSRANRTRLVSLAAHPGYASTNLQLAGLRFPPARWMMAATNAMFAISPSMGALPILCAATLPGLAGGSFVGPGRMGGYRGYPALVRAAKRADDQEVAGKLWQVSERATDVHYEFRADRPL
jgi:NAD(P)-dependent dehydrogenase (short-subunit alcohol dehydrogenase family)